MKPRLFIASSVEGVKVARAIHSNLDHEATITIWNHSVFDLSRTPLEGLANRVEGSDFGIFVFAYEDTTEMRDKSVQTVRDNVIFELGMFIGALGRDRSLIVAPRGVVAAHIPTDLHGMTIADYDPNREDKNLKAALEPACEEIRRSMEVHGPRSREISYLEYVKEDRARDRLEEMYRLHRNLAKKTGFAVTGNLINEYLLDHYMVKYNQALQDSYNNVLLLPSEPRMRIAMRAISKANSYVWAVSIVQQDQWHTYKNGVMSPYVKANMEAARRGVEIRRVIVVEETEQVGEVQALIQLEAAAGIQSRYAVYGDLTQRLKEYFDGSFAPVNILISDGHILTYSKKDAKHDGYLVLDRSRISEYEEKFDYIWDCSSPDL